MCLGIYWLDIENLGKQGVKHATDAEVKDEPGDIHEKLKETEPIQH